MKLSDVIKDFLSLTQDAVGVSYCAPGDKKMRLVHVNPAYTALFGQEPEDVLGLPVDEVHDSETWNTFAGKVDPLLKSGQKEIRVETSCLHADGHRFWASISLFVVRDPESGGLFCCATFRDISDLKAREDAAAKTLQERDKLIAEQERMYAELLSTQSRMLSAMNAYPDPFVIYDKDLRLVVCNRAYQSSMSTDPNRIKPGMHARDIVSHAFDCGLIDVPTDKRDGFFQAIENPAELAHTIEDIMLPDDVHHRVLRSVAEDGDWVIIRMNITELVRQRRNAEELQERLLSAISAYPAPFSIYDSNMRLVVWNEAYLESLTANPNDLSAGMTLEEVMKIGLREQRFTEAVGREEEWLRTTLEHAKAATPVEDMELAGDQHHRILRSRSHNGDLVVVRLDTTELVRQRRALQKTQDRLISAINAFPDPFSIYDRDLCLVIWNPAFARFLGEDANLIKVGMHANEVLSIAIKNGQIPAAVGREKEWLSEYVNPDMTKIEEEDFEIAGDRHYRIIRSRADNDETLVLRLNMTETVRQRRALEDYAAQLERANQQITFEALHDQLTGLGNRRYLSERFDELSKLRRTKGGELAALHIDLDRFKQINDTIGHAAGDQVLRDVARRIRTNVRRNDVVARIGGDEFVILLHLPVISDRPQQLADALLVDLVKPTIFEGRECRFGASIGIAHTPLANEEDLLTNSDVALYKAKRAGRGQMAIFDQSDIEEMRATKRLADDIIRALEGREFEPHYQPQVDARTGEVVGLEALARWRHPTRGILPPEVFLGVATDLNVVANIDRMIFEKAVEECQSAFARMPHVPSLSFNVSANRLQCHEIEEIGRLARSYAGKIAFELLETIFLEEESEAFMLQLDQLRELGISLEVDDFGSGRASIVALQRISPNQLKIDRRLVTPMARGNNATRLVRSIIDIGYALDIGVTAEGVETAEQAQLLGELGAERLQGYFFSQPLPLSELLDYLSRSEPEARLGTG
ncbi:EAL domain-containing protein [uncultured Roseobacter sp.]|uniref:sensor domain-containing protein n=1 Tax=uncultured Roseobacter sp. TaxID=114847 RepID=UPI0026296E03|nr:EAL domain-containing protein [uncultured Roseobacter sp.]